MKVRGPTFAIVVSVLLLWVLASSAHAYLIEGSKPTWWDVPQSDMYLKAEWTPQWNSDLNAAVDPFIEGGGAPPNESEVGPDLDPATFGSTGTWWAWSLEARWSVNVDEDGIIVPTGSGEYDFDLGLGNDYLLSAWKNWYLEFALDGLPTLEDKDGNYVRDWDPLDTSHPEDADRFHWAVEARNGAGGLITPSLERGGAWEKKGDHWIWWAEWKVEPQPENEKFLWQWYTDTSYPTFASDFHVSRVTVGTQCVPEPISASLLGLALVGGIAGLRKRRR